MIDERRLHHILGVARRCREIAEERGYNEDGQRQAFLLGWLHDIGYEFGDNVSHAAEGASLLVSDPGDLSKAGIGGCGENPGDYPYAREIFYHGVPAKERKIEEFDFLAEGFIDKGSVFRSPMLDILNRADMETMPDGKRCTAEQRLQDVEARYGKQSPQYVQIRELARELHLL